MDSLIDYIRTAIDPEEYYKHIFERLDWGVSEEARTDCLFHQDKSTPSLHLNCKSGKWYCHGCGKGGNSIVSFHAQYMSINKMEAAKELYHEFIHPTVPEKSIRRWTRTLNETPSIITYLTIERCISQQIIEWYELGWCNERVMIPIRNEFGLCINVKMFAPAHKNNRSIPKMLSYSLKDEHRSYAKPTMIFPMNVLLSKPPQIVVSEGEFDTLALLSLDIPAVTSVNGSKSWPSQYNERFRGSHVIIAYDNDQDGTTYDTKVVFNQLRKSAKTIKRLSIPDEVGKDVTDWIRHTPAMQKKEAWDNCLNKAKLLIENPDELIAEHPIVKVSLDQASQSKWYNQRIKVDGLVTGKDVAPYLLPKKFRVYCNKSCDDCPLNEMNAEFKEAKINPSDPSVLRYVDSTEVQVKNLLMAAAGMPCVRECSARVEIIEAINIEQLVLIPTLDSNSKQYVMRNSYYVGHGLMSNRAYEFEGVTVPHPQDQHTTHLFDQAKPVQDEVETFSLDEDMRVALQVFRPNRETPLIDHLIEIAQWQSCHVTKIRQRPDLHIAVDMVFHSLAAFEFNREFIRRGMLDVLILGDTRCGKGFVTEGLTRHYGVGEVASGEMCSFAGLVGGLQQVGKRWIITWGVIPLNHSRLVVIDEASSLAEADFSKLSRVRSEGVAEISKIIRESTQANTRLIWLSNTRSGMPIGSKNYGVEAIKELIGANEDISRFDFAMTVAADEVSSEVINAIVPNTVENSSRFPRALSRALILWAWSRRPDQIKFTEDATQEVISQAISMGHKYSSAIPLVQAENIRIKLAKISGSIAARVFSSDLSGELVIIERSHVQCARKFLEMVYDKESMRYDDFSRSILSSTNIPDEQPIECLFATLGQTRNQTIKGLLILYRITADSLGDYVGDIQAARMVIGDLVKLNCLSRMDRNGSWYLKNPGFNDWLRSQQRSSHVYERKVNRRTRNRN